MEGVVNRSHRLPHVVFPLFLILASLGLWALPWTSSRYRVAAFAEDRRPRQDRFSIATFNARFLFDGVAPEGKANFPWKNDPIAARAHLKQVAALLRSVDADFVHLSEVEDLPTLERLVLEIGDPSYRAYLTPGQDRFTRQNVGFLSRVDPDGKVLRSNEFVRSADGRISQGVAKNYGAHFRVGPLSLTIVGLHLLAFPDDPERARQRELQAEVVRRFTVREGTEKGRLLIVLGDFNDFDPAVSDVENNITRTHALKTIRGVGAFSETDDLANVATRLPKSQRYTIRTEPPDHLPGAPAQRSLTDHILVSRPLLPALRVVEIFDEAAAEPEDGGATRDEMGASDHLPLKATLDWDKLDIFRRGDTDDDSRVDTADGVHILLHLFARLPLDCLDSADANDDGHLQVTDVVFLLNRVHLQGTPLPAPGSPIPGADPTLDTLDCSR